MNNYEHNPRMTGKKQRDPEQFEDVKLNTTRTPYSGAKRVINITRVKKQKNSRVSTERDTLTTEGQVVVDEPAVSMWACNIYGFVAWAQVIYTLVLVGLVAAQASAELTVKVLLTMLLVHSFLASMLLGMNHKIDSLCAKSVDTEHSGMVLLRHVRDDRRSTLFFLSMVLSCVAAIDVAYIARVAKNWNTHADTFRQTGINTYVHRAMDILSMLVFALTVPVVLLIMTEVRFVVQAVMRHVKTPGSSQGASDDAAPDNDGSDDDGPEIVSPRD